MKVIVADKISERGIDLLKKTGWNIVQASKESLLSELADAEGLIVRSATRVTPELLDNAPHLRVVGRAGVGVDNIDLDEATKRGVLVMSTPGGSSVSVAVISTSLPASSTTPAICVLYSGELAECRMVRRNAEVPSISSLRTAFSAAGSASRPSA